MGPVITLTTDFGLKDGYPAALEGVIAGISPSARVITISHEVSPGDIAGAWYLLKTHHRYFPPGTIHLAVVDPGVGTRRKILAAATRRYQFVAPDNGILSFLPRREIISLRSVTDPAYGLGSVSPVFHGRDIMAPAAAYLSRGVDPACLGRPVRALTPLDMPMPRRRGGVLTGRIIWIDRFGNLITNIRRSLVRPGVRVSVDGRDVGPVRRTFADVRRGRPLAYVGSGGHLEIAVRDGSARDDFSIIDAADVEIRVA